MELIIDQKAKKYLDKKKNPRDVTIEVFEAANA